MPTYANPYGYRSPIGEAFGNLAKTLMSGPSEAERIKVAEEALKLKRTREGITRVSDLFGQYGGGNFDPSALASAAVTGNYDPSDLATMTRFLAANTHGATDPRTTNAFVGAGGAYSSTAPAFFTDQSRQERQHGATLAENARQFNMTPQEALVNGVPQFVPRSGAFDTGVAPILGETEQKGTLLGNNWSNLDALTPPQQRVLGADATSGNRAPFNYRAPNGTVHMTTDGVTDVQTGQPLPAGGARIGIEDTAEGAGLTNSTLSGLQKAQIEGKKLQSFVDLARNTVTSAPDTMFGLTGNVQSLAQDAAIIASNLSQGLGFSAPAEALQAIQADMAASGVNPSIISGVFDPRLGEMQSIYAMLVYATASGLAGQSGRDLSDADVERAKAMVGDPMALRASKQTMLSKLDAIERMLGTGQSVIDQSLGGTPGGATVPDASGGAAVERWIRGPDGTLQRAQ